MLPLALEVAVMFPWAVALFVVLLFAGGPWVVGIESAGGVFGTLAFVALLVILERSTLRGRRSA